MKKNSLKTLMNLDIINSHATLIPCNYINVVAGFIITSEGSGRFF